MNKSSNDIAGTTPKTVWFPRVKTDDLDLFEEMLRKAMQNASLEDMRRASLNAARYIENVSEDAGLDMTRINNATSTLCTVMGALIDEVMRLRAESEGK